MLFVYIVQTEKCFIIENTEKIYFKHQVEIKWNLYLVKIFYFYDSVFESSSFSVSSVSKSCNKLFSGTIIIFERKMILCWSTFRPLKNESFIWGSISGVLLELTVTLPLGAGAPKGENFTCNVIDNFHGLFSVESVTVNLQ